MFSFISLLQMSFSAAVIILLIIFIRAILINRLPKKIFLVLWMIALVRLLMPLSVSSPFSIYSLAQRSEHIKNIIGVMEEIPSGQIVLPIRMEKQESREEKENILSENAEDNGINHETASIEGNSVWKSTDDTVEYTGRGETGQTDTGQKDAVQSKYESKSGKEAVFPIWKIIYITGVIIFAVYFVYVYVKCRKEFDISMPVDREMSQNRINRCPTKRRISIRQSKLIDAPLTYGIIAPVILIPETIDWQEEEQLSYILAHEFIHIKRFDGVTKILMVAALCVHWFNPAVWIMYNLLNRDLEISCDEEVIRKFGEKSKASYARTLIQMEEKKSGLIPLWNSFSKNATGKSAMEERILAIMKMKKTSITGVFAGLILVLIMAIVFATSAMADSERNYLKRLPFEDLSDDESEKLLALWFEGYESMTVTEFQEKAWELTDTEEYRKLIEDFTKSEYAIQMEEGKEADALNAYMDYFYHVFEPLTAERWQTREFNGAVVMNLEPEGREQASLEYVISFHFLKPDELKVEEYRDARLLIREDMRSFLQGRTEEELSDQANLQRDVREIVNQIEKKYSSDKLEVSLAYSLLPLEEGWENDVNTQSKELWAETLAPYLEFGLTYQYIPLEDNPGNGLKMYWNGTEVRGIVDEERGMWISEHTGDGLYAGDAVELYVVYEKGEATGLRPAAKEEQKVWDKIRRNNGLSAKDSVFALEEENFEEEKRDFPNGSKEDYASLQKYILSDYKKMSVADFNVAILTWCNEDYERMERVGMDGALEDYAVPLTEEEKDFVAFTLWFSRMENSRKIQSEHTKKTEEDPEYTGKRMTKQSGDGLGWCTLDYRFTYHMKDKDKLEVGKRDECLKGMIKGIEEFWEETGLERLLLMSEEDIVDQLQLLAQKYGNDLLVIHIDEDMIHYQCMDERDIGGLADSL